MAWIATGWPSSSRTMTSRPAGPAGTDVEVTVALAHYADGVADCVLDVLVGNTVLTGVVRDLHTYAGYLACRRRASYLAHRGELGTDRNPRESDHSRLSRYKKSAESHLFRPPPFIPRQQDGGFAQEICGYAPALRRLREEPGPATARVDGPGER